MKAGFRTEFVERQEKEEAANRLFCDVLLSFLSPPNKFKKLHHIIANEQSSVAVFSVCLDAVISKLALLPPAAAGLLYLRLMSIFCQRRKKDGKGGRMMVPTERPRSWIAR